MLTNENGQNEQRGYSTAKGLAEEAVRRFHSGQFQEAVDAFTKVVAADPNYPMAYYNRALAYRKLGMLEEAKADFAKHASLNRSSGSSWPSTSESASYRHNPATGETVADADDDLTPEGMRRDLRGWGIGLIAIGIAQYFIPFLEPLMAFVLVPLGILSFFIAHRSMFIVIGIALVIIGLLNIFGGGFGLWTFYGGLQIYWGVQEIRKFGKYAYV